MDLRRRIWGRPSDESTTPLYHPLLALLPIVGSLSITTWFLSPEVGYLITGATLLVVCGYAGLAYGVLDVEIPVRIDTPFVILLGGYWLGLIAHYYHYPHTELLQYIVVTPLAVLTTVLVLPALIDRRRQAFTMALTLVAVLIAFVGFGMLVLETRTSEGLFGYVGNSVLGVDGLQTTSIFHNPNTYGFFMMIGSLAALYTYLVRRGALWFCALAICLVGFLLSEGDAAFLGFTAGAVLVLSGFDRRVGFLGIALAVLGVYVAIRLGHVGDVMGNTLMNRVNRWVASIERLSQDPLFGIGFGNAASEIGEDLGPHNSYVYPLLNTGVIAGGLYLSALVYALGQGVRTQWTGWTGFVVGTAVAIFLYMGFESLFLGGLSVSSILLGLSLGLLLYRPGDQYPGDERAESPASTA